MRVERILIVRENPRVEVAVQDNGAGRVVHVTNDDSSFAEFTPAEWDEIVTFVNGELDRDAD